MNGLMLHCGSHAASRDEVFAVPAPEATATYVPLSYESLVTRVEKQLRIESITILDEKLALAKNGQRLFGLMQLALPAIESRDYGCVLGLRNSYDKSFATGLCIGATVFVCDNLSFHGSHITFERKHTANLLRDLTWIITETVAKLPGLFAAQSRSFEVYRNTSITDGKAHDLVIRCYDEDALNGSDIPRVLHHWREPVQTELAEGGKNAWRFFNAVTETIKGDLWRLPARTGALHRVLDAACGLSPSDGDQIRAGPDTSALAGEDKTGEPSIAVHG
ncbi:MAG: DUF932 domain-containing protein [Bryobacteraceae bacterium]|nr:DUF932 domain-containing protein [Bryobacteraceae bacterium]